MHTAESSDVADQVADLAPPEMADFIFLLICSYSESSDLADKVADLPPQKMVILDSYWEIPTLRAQIWQTRWQI